MTEINEETKTIRISLNTWRNLNQMRGFNNCKTFEDVLLFLINNQKSEKTEE